MLNRYPREFRDDVVAVARRGEASLKQVAKDFGISESCLTNWLKAADVEDGKRAGGFTAYNVCSGEPRTIGEMVTTLATASGGPSPVVTGQYRLGDVRHVFADPTVAARELGFTANVSFADGMQEFATTELRQ